MADINLNLTIPNNGDLEEGRTISQIDTDESFDHPIEAIYTLMSQDAEESSMDEEAPTAAVQRTTMPQPEPDRTMSPISPLSSGSSVASKDRRRSSIISLKEIKPPNIIKKVKLPVKEPKSPVATKDHIAMHTLSKEPLVLTKEQISKTIQQAARDSHMGDRGSAELNEVLLYQAVCAAGAWAYGVVATEVWVLNPLTGSLEQPAGGYWRDSVFPPSQALRRIEDSTCPDHVPPRPLAPGEGLAGALWSEAGKTMLAKLQSRRRLDENELPKRNVVWRSIKALSEDPDQPPSERLQLLGQAGFGLAAGVTFQIKDVKGIVVYMARANSESHQLQSHENESYLASAADLIGAEVALAANRAMAIHQRIERRRVVLEKARNKIRTALAMSRRPSRVQSQLPPQPQPKLTCMDLLRLESQHATQFATKQWAKFRGTHVEPPPRGKWLASLISFAGSFVTLLAIERLNALIKLSTEGEMSIIMGPIAALVCMQYALTGAPASQPRNALYGQSLCVVIALIIEYIPLLGEYSVWLRPTLSTSLAITAMVGTGTVHPPGAATALLVATGHFTWAHLALLIVAYLMCIIMSALINNWFDQRQYPIYWALTYGTPFYHRDLSTFFKPKQKAPYDPEKSIDSTQGSGSTKVA